MDAYETSLYTAVLTGCIIIALLILFFAFSIIRQQKRILELNRSSIRAEVTALEKERTRIAKDLHDELGPTLAVIRFQIDNPAPHEAGMKQQMRVASEQINEVIGRMREIAGDLMPALLFQKGLAAAIQEFTARAGRASGVSIHFRHQLHTPLSQEVLINIYRMVQECLHNALKHAACTQIHLQLKEEDGQLHIVCQDNGKGFDTSGAAPGNRGLGLASLQSRTRFLQGAMHLKTSPGAGTYIHFIIPTDEAHTHKNKDRTGR